jgi:hypothetical protein
MQRTKRTSDEERFNAINDEAKICALTDEEDNSSLRTAETGGRRTEQEEKEKAEKVLGVGG